MKNITVSWKRRLTLETPSNDPFFFIVAVKYYFVIGLLLAFDDSESAVQVAVKVMLLRKCRIVDINLRSEFNPTPRWSFRAMLKRNGPKLCSVVRNSFKRDDILWVFSFFGWGEGEHFHKVLKFLWGSSDSSKTVTLCRLSLN